MSLPHQDWKPVVFRKPSKSSNDQPKIIRENTQP